MNRRAAGVPSFKAGDIMAMIFVNVAMFLAVPECRSARSRRERPQRRGHERDALAHGQEFLDVLESQD